MSYQGKNVLVRRLSFALKHGTEPSKLKAQRVWSTCCSQTCINPGCLRGGSHSNSFSAQAKMGLFKRSPAAKVSAAIAKRSVSDLDMGKVRDIRKAIEKGESVAVVARRYRKSHSLVRKIRDNECWREAAVGASVFHQVAA
ncbi:MAG TPA: hypothetical protein VFH49_08670 [Aquabacterium sp.]|nr:hypothetical protein [Aquabacterium sp.]